MVGLAAKLLIPSRNNYSRVEGWPYASGKRCGQYEQPIIRLLVGACTTSRCMRRMSAVLASLSLPPSTSNRSTRFGHAPGIEQFSEPLFWQDFLFLGHLAHGLA
jgi:hypothetical protein